MSVVSAKLRKAVGKIYSPTDAAQVIDAIENDPEAVSERVQCAAVKTGGGSLEKFMAAWRGSKIDFRDTLMAAGFGHDPKEHLRWLDSF